MGDLHFNLWSVLIIVGAVQALFLVIMLWKAKGMVAANRWFVALLLVVAFNLIEYAFAITGLNLTYPHLMASSYPWLFCLGPCYWLFIQYQTQEEFDFDRKHVVHFFASSLVLFILLPFYLQTGDEKRAFILSLNEGGTLGIPTGQYVFLTAYLLQTSAYIIWSYKQLRRVQHHFQQQSSNPVFKHKIATLLSFTGSFMSWLVMYLVLVTVLFFTQNYQAAIDYSLVLVTSILIYVMAYWLIRNPDILKEFPEEEDEEVT